MRDPLIACNADHVSNIPLKELNSEKNKMEVSLKLCLPSAVSIPMKAYPTVPLSGQKVKERIAPYAVFYRRLEKT
jgi:hypothetical protein